jgi:hypothetical protein
MSVSICFSLLIGTQTNAITGTEYMTKPDWYKNLYNTFLSAEIKEAELARKSMVINGMTEVQWLEKNAKTINAVQRVVRTDNATTVSYRQSIKPEDQAVRSLVPDILETALTWQAQILFTVGRIALDLSKNSLEDDNLKNTPSPKPNATPPNVLLTTVSTPAGVRVKKIVSGSLNYPTPQTNEAAFSKAISKGAHVYRTTQCLLGMPCENLPQLPTSLATYIALVPVNPDQYYTYVDEEEYYYEGEVKRSTGVIYTTVTVQNTTPIFGAIAAFSNIDNLISYLNSSGICALPYVYRSHFYTSDESSLKGGPVCSHSYKTIINANYTELRIDIYNKITSFAYYYPYTLRFTDQLVLQVTPLEYLSTNIQSMPFSKDELNARVPRSTLIAHLNNLLKRASQLPDYDGLPYTPTDPIRESEITDRFITLRDLLGATTTETGELYISPDGKTQDPFVVQYVINNNCTGTNSCNTGGGSDIDLQAPDAKEPDLEPIPTALSILQPLLNLILPYRDYVVAKPATECPKSSFEALNRTWILDVHCDMFESVRDLLSAVMLSIFAFASFRIVMKA